MLAGRISRGNCDPAAGFDAITGRPTTPDLRTMSSADTASSNSNARTNVNKSALILYKQLYDKIDQRFGISFSDET